MTPYLHDDHPATARAGKRRAQARSGGAQTYQVAPLGPDCIDGSQDGLRRFLVEMAQTMGDEGEVLALQLGDIVVQAMAAQDGLTLCARLPRDGGRQGRRERRSVPDGCELAWHAEAGCEVLVRHLPLAALRSEPDVLDAMLDCADLARVL